MPADGKSKEGRHSTAYLSFKKIFYFSIFVLLALLFWTPRNMLCQETGLKYIKNYTPNDYNLLPQNFSIIQDQRGVIYVANREGLLEYDGVSWRLIPIPNQTVRSLEVDDTGTIYIGGIDEFGYLVPGPNGNLRYLSLSEQLEHNQKNFSRVWRTHLTKGGIYFRTPKYLFRWRNSRITILPPEPWSIISGPGDIHV